MNFDAEPMILTTGATDAVKSIVPFIGGSDLSDVDEIAKKPGGGRSLLRTRLNDTHFFLQGIYREYRRF